MISEKSFPQQSRRAFLVRSAQTLVSLATVAVLPDVCYAKATGKRTLSFYHMHAEKELTLTYAAGRRYSSKALAQINFFLRDYQTGQIHQIDPKLLDILWAVQQKMGRKGVYNVVSAFRSPETNRLLRSTHSGVAKHSLHMQGRAIDIHFSGADLNKVRQCATAMRTGGIGYYPQSDFVHLDTGDYRTW